MHKTKSGIEQVNWHECRHCSWLLSGDDWQWSIGTSVGIGVCRLQAVNLLKQTIIEGWADRVCHRKVKINFSWKSKMGSEKIKPFYVLNMGNILIFHLKHSKLHFFALTLYKENFKKYKVKFQKSVFWNFELLNLIKSCLVALVCIPEVLMLLLTPILPYLYMACVGWHMCQIWHFWHFWHKWRIWHPPSVIIRYGNIVSKDPSGCQECWPMLLNNFWIGLTA